ncbi:hypothetical protein ACHAWF_011791 [Thalassiosira exigua]
MAGAKKRKTSSSKKNKSRKNNGSGGRKKPLPLEEVLRQADSAMEMSDVDTALQLFSYAAGMLRSRVHAPAGDGSSNTAMSAMSVDDQNKVTLSTVLGKMGELKASNGDVESARSDFLAAIELLGDSSSTLATCTGDDGEALDKRDPTLSTAQNCESRAGLHLYLGQLSSGDEALASFRLGVSELEKAVSVLELICAGSVQTNGMDMEVCDEGEAINPKQFLVETRRQLCAAHCSIAELYLTDLCEGPNAESSCEDALRSAMALDETLLIDASQKGQPIPDVMQTMANLRLSQSRVPEAVECILKAYDRMKVGCEAMSALVGLAGSSGGQEGVEVEPQSRELVEVEAASSLPEYNFRCQSAKMMLECASLVENDDSCTKDMANQCVEPAIQVLGSLLAENDEVIEVWYLLGCAFAACTPPNQESAHYYWENALSMLMQAKEGLEASTGEDCQNELETVECQIIEVKKKLGMSETSLNENEDAMET